MCIRDSDTPVGMPAADYFKVEKDVIYEIGLTPNRSDATNPVSYTHLRAHETVLDLVCRLLLEKKKNHNKITITPTN